MSKETKGLSDVEPGKGQHGMGWQVPRAAGNRSGFYELNWEGRWRIELACRDQLGEASAGLLHALTPEGSGRLDEDWRRVVGVL
ncbi:hypothetical protein CCUS01_07889 [Colletotrichum cuscutae]|uniref:Uncharacterized protein n=1 Tax=Colletotrichum cuscutae TaxID=1209917 RepID=A0AAI9UYZ8_9PEZI|nr:hypothetical protein CCUS01_07889 [Colletotrichum cuscutae]